MFPRVCGGFGHFQVGHRRVAAVSMYAKAAYHNKLANCHSFEWYLELNGFLVPDFKQ